MKKIFSIMLILALLSMQIAWAAELPDLSVYSDKELEALSEALEAEKVSRQNAGSDNVEPEEIERETLQKGSKSDSVKELQLRLIELNYLSGRADGSYGTKTKNAVEEFQKRVGLPADGIADGKTQAALFAEDAPAVKVYKNLNFKTVSRDPNSYKGQNYKFSGKVLQVMESSNIGYTYVAMRIATRGSYNDVVYVTYNRSDGESRILEGDRVTVQGTLDGLYTYTSTVGKSVTLPLFAADTVALKK